MSSPTAVFLDANIYFTAFSFPEGVSSFIFSLARKNQLSISAIPLVLKEADCNLRHSPRARAAFHQFLREVKIQVRPDPETKAAEKYKDWLGPTDSYVWAGAAASEVLIFITLDRTNFADRRLLPREGAIQIKTPLEILS